MADSDSQIARAVGYVRLQKLTQFHQRPEAFTGEEFKLRKISLAG